MTEAARIADQLRRTFHGQAWHGPAVLELLADVSAARAAARPLPRAHSIWEIVLHMGVWESAAHSYLTREIPAFPVLEGEQDWPPVRETSPAHWKQAVDSLTQAHDRLVELAGKLSEAQLRDKVAGREYSVYFLLHGLAQHNLYHAGQIALLKKAVASG